MELREYSHASMNFDWDSNKWYVNVYAFYGDEDFVRRNTIADGLTETQARRVQDKFNRMAKRYNAIRKQGTELKEKMNALDTYNLKGAKNE